MSNESNLFHSYSVKPQIRQMENANDKELGQNNLESVPVIVIIMSWAEIGFL